MHITVNTIGTNWNGFLFLYSKQLNTWLSSTNAIQRQCYFITDTKLNMNRQALDESPQPMNLRTIITQYRPGITFLCIWMTSHRMSANVSWFLAWHEMTVLKNSIAAASISSCCSLLTSCTTHMHTRTHVKHVQYTVCIISMPLVS